MTRVWRIQPQSASSAIHYGPGVPSSSEQLELVADAREVVIETRSGDRVTGTVIWVVVDDGEVFVRSVRGESARWYQRVLADPHVTLRIGDFRLPFIAVPAGDDDSVERTSEALRRKYPKGSSLDAMLRREVLSTTLLLQSPE
jgi:hypothetical protein